MNHSYQLFNHIKWIVLLPPQSEILISMREESRIEPETSLLQQPSASPVDLHVSVLSLEIQIQHLYFHLWACLLCGKLQWSWEIRFVMSCCPKQRKTTFYFLQMTGDLCLGSESGCARCGERQWEHPELLCSKVHVCISASGYLCARAAASHVRGGEVLYELNINCLGNCKPQSNLADGIRSFTASFCTENKNAMPENKVDTRNGWG